MQRRNEHRGPEPGGVDVTLIVKPADDAALTESTASGDDRGCAVGVVDIDVYDDQDRLCAVGRGCYGTSNG